MTRFLRLSLKSWTHTVGLRMPGHEWEIAFIVVDNEKTVQGNARFVG